MKHQFLNLYYNKSLQPYANELRKNFTKAEACLWKFVLRARMMRGFQFRRQRPVLHYIADFMCKELMLIIEVDGNTHHSLEALVKDERRQKALENLGFTVVRFTDNEVLHNIDGVQIFLENWIDQKESNKE